MACFAELLKLAGSASLGWHTSINLYLLHIYTCKWWDSQKPTPKDSENHEINYTTYFQANWIMVGFIYPKT